MKINRKVISDRELFEKSIDVVEYLVNAKIGLQISKGDNWCNFGGIDKIDSKKMYLINLSSSRNSAIPRYTALIHELGHILYETPFTPIKKLLRKWDPQTYWQDTSHAVDLYHTIFNVLEDQRIESQISKSYLGHKKRFEKTRHDLGKAGFGDYEDMENPAFGLLAIRFMRDDLIKNTKYYHIYKQALDNVEETDRFGALRVLISIKDCIDEFLAKKESSKQGTQNHNLKTKLDQETNVFTSLSEEEKQEIIKNVERNFGSTICEENRRKIIAQAEKSKKETYDTFQSKNKKHNQLKKSSSPDFSIPPELNKERHSQDQIRELLKNGKEEGEKQHQEIREKLIARNRTDNTLPNVKKILRPASNYTIDYKTAKGLNKVFKLLKLRSKSAIDFTGSQIDINEYVENLTKGTNLNRCYENRKPDIGASIIISIDASSSMISDQKIIIARNLVGTLFKSINGVKNTEIRGNIWGSNTSGEIGITEINNIQDVKRISAGNYEHSYPYTPLHMGLEYSMKMLKEMRGRKKLLILITDGFPNYHRNGDSIPNNIYKQQCKKSLQKVLTITPNVVCLLVGPEHDEIKRIMTEIFTSKRFIIVPNMQKASQNIVKKFRQFIAKNVQNPF